MPSNVLTTLQWGHKNVFAVWNLVSLADIGCKLKHMVKPICFSSGELVILSSYENQNKQNKVTPFDFGDYLQAKSSFVFISSLQPELLINSQFCWCTGAWYWGRQLWMKNVHFHINYCYSYLVCLLTWQVWKGVIYPNFLSWRKRVVEAVHLQNHLKGDDTGCHRIGSKSQTVSHRHISKWQHTFKGEFLKPLEELCSLCVFQVAKMQPRQTTCNF